MGVILWQDLTTGGLDRCALETDAHGGQLRGTVLLSARGAPVEVRYRVGVDPDWHTRQVELTVEGVGPLQTLRVEADGQGGWWCDGAEIKELEGCLDVDLAMTPSTNTLPLRRLQPRPGQVADVRAAWLAFPELTWSASEQTYECLAAHRYLFRSGTFSAELLVDEDGLVLDYQGAWLALTRS